jgi:Ca2+-transporting ATPase
MVTIHDHPELGRIELAKGAPDVILARSDDLDASGRRSVEAQNDAMASRGLRVLAFAWKRQRDEKLRFAGLVGLHDPPRPFAREAVAALREAGIHTMMLTGDQEATAVAVARALGISENAVYSRVTPETKLDIVRDLQEQGRIVAMTGDGVNDGPALKAADVGVAMGERGTDLARAVADVVLEHDDLPSLVQAIAEGRTLHDNIRRSIQYMIATNASEVMVTLAGALIGMRPLSPFHLLWINILTDIAPALALAVEPPEAGVMKRGPRDAREDLLGEGVYRQVGARSLKMAGAALGSYAWGALGGGGAAYASTMAFTSLVVAQLLEAQSHRTESVLPNRKLAGVLGVSLLLQGGAVLHPGLQSALGNAALRPLDFVVSLAAGAMGARTKGRPFLPPIDAIVVTHPEAVSGERKEEV